MEWGKCYELWDARAGMKVWMKWTKYTDEDKATLGKFDKYFKFALKKGTSQ